jgi:hypothetical protein
MAAEQYRTYIQQLLKQHAKYKAAHGEVEAQTIFDKENDRYLLVHVGWNGSHRIYGCVLHLDIKDGKIWVQQDGTELGIANELVELGVPTQDIVLGFHSAFMRKFTEFAVC